MTPLSSIALLLMITVMPLVITFYLTSPRKDDSE